jgi:hypothetical protein
VVAGAIGTLDQAHHLALLVGVEHRDQKAAYGVAALHAHVGKRTADTRRLQRGETQSQRFAFGGNE